MSADFARIVCRWARIMWRRRYVSWLDVVAYDFEKLAKLHCVQTVPRLTHSGASTLTIQSYYECLPCFHDLFTRGFKLSKGRVKTSEVASILSVDTLSLPYRYYVLSDTVKY